MTRPTTKTLLTLLAFCVFLALRAVSAQSLSGALYTTNHDATPVNWNVYSTKTDVYISGGPQNANANGLPDGTYYFQVTDPSGKKLLSTDNASCRQLLVSGGRVAGATGGCPHPNGTLNTDNGVLPVQLAPFSDTPNSGGEYKVWVVSTDRATVGADLKTLTFANKDAKTDNFKVVPGVISVGSCQPSSSLSVMTSGTNVVSYVPKGNWSVTHVPGIAVVNVEGSATLPSTNPISTGADIINSCASNSTTGQTACTANNANVYVISGLAAVPTVNTLTTSGSGTISFSGGVCTNCGIAMDGVHNKAVIGLSLAGVPGFQFLNMAANTFEPAFATQTPTPKRISEDPLLDPIRNLLLNPNESNQYEIVNVATSTVPTFFENGPIVSGGVLDSAGEDCQTGIILAPAEGAVPSHVFIANLSSSAAAFTSGAPGTWTAPSQVQILSESSLAAGASGIAIAQGAHSGIVAGEFGGGAITAIQLPATADTSTATPAIPDWVTCTIPGFTNGYDPHTVTAYQSPTSGHAIALLANAGATLLERVDLTAMLDPTIVPRTAGGHGCTSGTLPATVVSAISVP
jgi:hypothetical protein